MRDARRGRRRGGALGVAAAVVVGSSAAFGQSLLPRADGTLVDGGIFGPFDGLADQADWSFNESSYEGTITLAPDALLGIEHRVVWEYDLSGIVAESGVGATLSFTLRGVARFPAEAAVVHVYAYAADLLETLTDFYADPATLVAARRIEPFQPATPYTVDVSLAVNEALAAGRGAIGFRFQIDRYALASSQAFMDVLDAEPGTKPVLTVAQETPGDADGDGDLDLDDFAALAACLGGPGSGVSPACRHFDFDRDNDLDLLDASQFERLRSLLGG